MSRATACPTAHRCHSTSLSSSSRRPSGWRRASPKASRSRSSRPACAGWIRRSSGHCPTSSTCSRCPRLSWRARVWTRRSASVGRSKRSRPSCCGVPRIGRSSSWSRTCNGSTATRRSSVGPSSTAWPAIGSSCSAPIGLATPRPGRIARLTNGWSSTGYRTRRPSRSSRRSSTPLNWPRPSVRSSSSGPRGTRSLSRS